MNHVLPYSQLFGPNALGTAELIRIALTSRIKPFAYVSTIGVGAGIEPGKFVEDADIRVISPTRAVDDGYANGYGNSKWAGEVLLREAHDLCGLPVSVFRCDMILADTTYAGQLNLPDMFTRMMLSPGWPPGSRPGRSTNSTPTATGSARTTTACRWSSSPRRSPCWARTSRTASRRIT